MAPQAPRRSEGLRRHEYKNSKKHRSKRTTSFKAPVNPAPFLLPVRAWQGRRGALIQRTAILTIVRIPGQDLA
jgi:hypothetical protein